MYLDYTGGGLHAASQIDAHAELLRTQVLGNPHSGNPTSLASTALVERARGRCASSSTPRPTNTSASSPPTPARRCGSSARRTRSGRAARFALTFDNHNSVNGIREFARRKGADIEYVPVVAPELRIDRTAMTRALAGRRSVGAQPARLSGPVELLRRPAPARPGRRGPRRRAGTCSSTPPPSPRRTGSTSPGSGPTS